MNITHGFKVRDIIRNIGARSIIASLLVFFLTVGATAAGA